FVPYALFGDFLGDYHPGLGPGSHVLDAVPYTASDLGGTPGTALRLTFSLVEQAPTPSPSPSPSPTPTPSPAPSPSPSPSGNAVISFSLIDTDKDGPVAGFDPIPGGAV